MGQRALRKAATIGLVEMEFIYIYIYIYVCVYLFYTSYYHYGGRFEDLLKQHLVRAYHFTMKQ